MRTNALMCILFRGQVVKIGSLLLSIAWVPGNELNVSGVGPSAFTY